jgi:rod shape determining protein RodA
LKLAVWAGRLPWSIPALATTLLALGCLGIARCEELAEGSGQFTRQQMVWTALGVVAMMGASLVSYRALCRWSYLIFGVALGLLAVVYAFPPINGAHRWIRVGPLGVQPSELAKLAFVLALAKYLMYGENYRRLTGLIPPLALAVMPVVLIAKEPDLGTAAVFLPVLFIMLLAAGARRRDLACLLLGGALLLPLVWTQMSREQKSRVTALFDQPALVERPSNENFQLHQAKRVMALGGIWGSLLTGQPTEDAVAYRLPEARTDFIFCVLGERFGVAGLGVVLTLYGLLVWRGLAIASATREPFGRLVAVGIVTVLAVQVLINTGMTLGLLPVKGLPLPLLSYGGSGLLAHALALGLLVNIGLRPGYEVANEPFRWAVGSGE